MVPEDIFGDRFCYIPSGTGQMIETFPAVRLFRHLTFRQHGVGLHDHPHGVDHPSFGGTGMDRYAAHGQTGHGRVKVLVIYLRRNGSVHRIGQIRTELLQIQQISPLADLLIRRKAYGNLSVRDPLIDQPFAHGHDLGNARLVVGSQDRGPVRGQDGLPDTVLQMGKYFRVQDPAGPAQPDHAAVIAADDLGMGIGPAAVIHGIQMGNKPNGGTVLIARRCRQEAIGISMFIYKYIFQPQCFHLHRQEPGQNKLTFACGRSFPVIITGRIDDRVSK